MPLSPRTLLGTYEILAPLGAGGMGEVYRARDRRLDRDVALKVLPGEVASSPERLARFEREARTIAGLNHPNIVTLHSIEEEDGVHFLTMELVEGQSLATLASARVPFTRVLEIGLSLVGALEVAHARGVVHRDLKPGNVMVGYDGRVKVLDFGLATSTRPRLEPERTRSAPISIEGQVIGTLPYMAPEQVRGEAVDPRTDLFAVGVILYELAAGHRPFQGASAADVASSILRDTPPPLAGLRPDLPVELERIVGRCLEKDPRKRYPTASDLGRDLERAKLNVDERGTARSSEEAPSIAVLPFVNRSRDEDDEYFSDGLADELLNVLSKVGGLRVAARTSSFQFKNRNEDVAVIGEKLRVATLLEGSVRRAGNRVRVAVQLIKVPDGYHIWSETYDRTLEDIFAVQDDIARTVVQELRTTLLPGQGGQDASGRARADVASAVKGRGHSAESHRLLLRGKHLLERVTRQDVARGMEYLKDAVRADPGNARAWTQLARGHLIESGYGWAPLAEGVDSAQEAIRRALAVEPDLPEAHMMLGRLRLEFLWDWEGAKLSYRRARELAPGIAVGMHGFGILLEYEGRSDEAIEFHRLAVEQDPLNSGAYIRLGKALHSADRLAEAEAAFRSAVELAPQRVTTNSSLALSLLAQGRASEALEVALREREDLYRLQALAMIHHALGNRSESDEALRAMIAKCSNDAALQIAEAYAARGERDEAFAWLERAYLQRDPGLAELKLSRILQVLHGDSRWPAFLVRMGLDP